MEDELKKIVKRKVVRYIKNNGRPSTITIDRQLRTGYINKDGEKKEIRVVCWRDPAIMAKANDEARELALPKNKKQIFRYKLVPDISVPGGIRRKEEMDKRIPIGQLFRVNYFPHIMGCPVGESHKDERIYTIKIKDVVPVRSDGDANHILKIYQFCDEVNAKGEVIDVRHEQSGRMVKGNPYRPLPSEKADPRRSPIKYEEVDTSQAPRKTAIEERVDGIKHADSEEAKLIKKED